MLERCRRAGAWSDAVIGGVCDAEGLDVRDRALTAALCYGEQQNRTLLDYVIRQRSTLPLNRIEPKVLDILRLSVYQLLFLDKIPASAAVNEAVTLCRQSGYTRATGFVNAVLRGVATDPAIPEIPGNPVKRLSIRWSHPEWLVAEWLETLGEAETEALLRLDNAPAPLTIQTNTIKIDTQSLRSALAEEGVQTKPHPFLADCLIAEAGDLSKTAAFRDGWFYVQDAASRMAVLAAAPKQGQRILDVCAAPGGKSFAAAVLTGGAADIIACDLHPNKLRRIRDGAARLGLDCIMTLARDAREERPDWDGAFDLVLADVPCSGLGVIRKKPDIRWKDPGELDRLPKAQHAILCGAAASVAAGGTLLYSTCTVRERENFAVVRRFLAEYPAFVPEDFVCADGSRSENGMLQLWPQRQHTDGFFIAKLRKRN